MKLVPSEELARLVRFVRAPGKQTASDRLTLTLLDVYQIVGEARVTSDPAAVEKARRIKRPSRKKAGTEAACWDLVPGAYWVTYNESVRIPEGALLYLEVHPSLAANGVLHPSRLIRNWDEVPGQMLNVVARGVRLEEGAPVSTGWMIRF